jgi:hypothetical protein
VSSFLTKTWFWEQLRPAEKVFMFQTDSIICSNSPRTVDDFLEYDMIGAPVVKHLGSGFNGGLGIRSVPLILDILKTEDWATDRADNGEKYREVANIDYEDQWFYAKMLERKGTKFPSQEVASRFAVETIWEEEPLGFHQPLVYMQHMEEKISEWCPEYRLATQETFKSHG